MTQHRKLVSFGQLTTCLQALAQRHRAVP